MGPRTTFWHQTLSFKWHLYMSLRKQCNSILKSSKLSSYFITILNSNSYYMHFISVQNISWMAPSVKNQNRLDHWHFLSLLFVCFFIPSYSNIFKHKRQCMTTHTKLKIRRAAKYFWRILSCFETLSWVIYMFTINELLMSLRMSRTLQYIMVHYCHQMFNDWTTVVL